MSSKIGMKLLIIDLGNGMQSWLACPYKEGFDKPVALAFVISTKLG